MRWIARTLLNRIVAAGLWISLIGTSMNWTAIQANNGMPVLGRNDRSGVHVPMTRGSRLPFLCDWIPVREVMTSPGDVVIFGGILVAMFGAIGGGLQNADDRRRIT